MTGVQTCALPIYWGVRNASSALRWMARDQVRACLLPRDTARITRQGIRFKRLYYMSPTAIKDQWFVKASLEEWTIDVAYHPRSTEILFICLDHGRTLEPCQLLERVNEVTWKGQDVYDLEDYFKIRALDGRVADRSKTNRTAAPVAQQEAIVHNDPDLVQSREQAADSIPAGTLEDGLNRFRPRNIDHW